MKMKFNKVLPYIVAVVVFVLITVLYCYPMLSGKVLNAGDVHNWQGGAHEAQEYFARTGETTWWTNSMFGGMPTFQITGSTPTQHISNHILRRVLHLGFGEIMGIIFGYLLGFFLMLRCFRVNPWLSIAGSIALALSSYFFIIIPAGHITKAVALGFLAPLFGGVYAVFRRRYWLGVPLIVVYGIAGIALHPQMTYYIFMLIGVCFFAELYIHIKEKRWKELGISLLVITGCLLLVMGTRLSWFQSNNEYLAQTMRGGHSELTKDDAQDAQPQKGLDIEYATAWSYGIDETLTLLIPNIKGGASGYSLDEKSETYQTLVKGGYPKKQAAKIVEQLPMYWGKQPFTSGPVYVGAIICMLFILGLMIVDGPYKWALLVATCFSIMLAWGKNFMPLTELFYNYFPMYNKFRAVSSVLIVAEITMPLLGFMALQKIISSSPEERQSYLKPLYISSGITAGLCLIIALFGGMIWDFRGANDPTWLADAFIADRKSLLRADSWRSLLFIVAAAVVIYFYLRNKMKAAYLYALLAVLITADMVPVDRRYFSSRDFVSQKENDSFFAMQPWEQQILGDKSLDYRVLNLTANTFNDSRTSYRLKSIGGYHAAKLRRYQDLIDAHISKNNMAVINMLNTKYFVTKQGVMQNPDAMGNAWFVDNVKFVSTPDEESAALWQLDLKYEAVADERFKDILLAQSEGEAQVTMTDYQPNKLTYHTISDTDKTLVFSEIYYPSGWHLLCDGEEIAIARANYTLRAATIPAGEHTLTMSFEPDALKTDHWCMAILIVALLLSLLCATYPLYSQPLLTLVRK